ncbi:MAG: DNA cytosine methyltransferase [Thermoguttaceae bacterium]
MQCCDDYLLDFIRENIGTTETTLRDYFGCTLDFDFYYRHPRNYCRRAIFSIDEPAPTIRGVNRPVPRGYLGNPNDACALNPSIRALTTLERALIQTFPADFKWLGTKTEMEQMIGNAVPVKLAEFVARCLKHHIEKEIQWIDIDNQKFVRWLQKTHSFTERTQCDMLSRLKRANAICEIHTSPIDDYIFRLEKTPEYHSLTPSVRSQLKRAFSLYVSCCKERKNRESLLF